MSFCVLNGEFGFRAKYTAELSSSGFDDLFASGLDSETEADLLETLEELTRGKTTITIAHRRSMIEAADRSLVLERGKIIRAA